MNGALVPVRPRGIGALPTRPGGLGQAIIGEEERKGEPPPPTDYTPQPGRVEGPWWIPDDGSPPVCLLMGPRGCLDVSPPGGGTAPPPPTYTPPAPSAPPTPYSSCYAPGDVVLDYTERWVEVDPVECLWQIVRTTRAGQPIVLPEIYTGRRTVTIPQSAPPAVTALSPGSVGLYQPGIALYQRAAPALLPPAIDTVTPGFDLAGWARANPYLLAGGAVLAVVVWSSVGGRRR